MVFYIHTRNLTGHGKPTKEVAQDIFKSVRKVAESNFTIDGIRVYTNKTNKKTLFHILEAYGITEQHTIQIR